VVVIELAVLGRHVAAAVDEREQVLAARHRPASLEIGGHGRGPRQACRRPGGA
jgi:hypothetical protein